MQRVVTTDEMAKCARLVLLNQLFLLLPFSLLHAYIMQTQQQRISLMHVPSWSAIVLQLAVCVVVEEVLFYYSHRLLVSHDIS